MLWLHLLEFLKGRNHRGRVLILTNGSRNSRPRASLLTLISKEVNRCRRNVAPPIGILHILNIGDEGRASLLTLVDAPVDRLDVGVLLLMFHSVVLGQALMVWGLMGVLRIGNNFHNVLRMSLGLIQIKSLQRIV